MIERKLISRDRFPLVLWFVFVFLAISSLTRIVLILSNISELSSAPFYIPLSLLVGIVMDLYVALYVTLPLALIMLILPLRWRNSRWFYGLFATVNGLFAFGLLYLGATEYFFFDEFNSRLNYIAVDYLIYPHEVFVNIWDTYPVLSVLIITAVASTAFALLTRKIIKGGTTVPETRKGAAGMLLVYAILIILGAVGLNIDTTRISDNRALNEITANGLYSFVYAGLTNELSYNGYYARIDREEAANRLRKLLANDHTTFLNPDTGLSIDRYVESDHPLRKFNIVLVLEESFGSNFVGRLHPEGKCLTPEFDRVSAEHGLLFTHVYATGNRTVRGIEATLASFPPIPGRSIVKRPGNEHVFTLSALLKKMDYSTVFIYGGLSYFDNIGHFAENNGYDRVIDEVNFEDPLFTTIWGVCDEDLYNKSLTVFDSLHILEKPFFATLLTVSNHSPYTYPTGRIPYDPEEHIRENSVRYADYAIGYFIEKAESHPFFDSTLFIFVADHGARVYGSNQIPMRSYEIPLLFYNPVLIPSGRTCGVIGSQLDIGPTILDFLGFDYNSEFFGRSLLATSKDRERVLMSHNRDVSLLRDSTIAVLGIQGNTDTYRLDSTSDKFDQVYNPRDTDLIPDAITYYMLAYDMFRDHLLHPLNQPISAK